MIVRVETERGENGEQVPVRVFHRAGSLADGSGGYRADEKYAWTHPYEERETCVACTLGQIPPEVKSG